ncbi:MAG TPA: molybdate ABC transporter substrate-binding protein [Verrucomicrobiae bacterium]|nr:molybdate ABC transporter substrate-binding protein [Verrucomicrobiae bacterium]
MITRVTIVALMALWHAAFAPAGVTAEILVSAATSLKDALGEIGQAYRANIVRFNFASSSELERQIEAGAPADIFFSADLEKMDRLDAHGLIDRATRRNILSNRLVMIARVDSRLALRHPRDLLKPEVKRIVLAQPDSVPAGIYARKFLQAEGLWSGVAPKVVPVLDVRATLAAVESGNVDAGFVYKTDAAISRKIKVLYEVPSDKGPKIVYPIAVTANSKVKPAAADFIAYFAGANAKSTLTKYGFIVLE